MKYKINNEKVFIATETRVLPMRFKGTEQRAWFSMKGTLHPVNILMHIASENKEKGTVTYECKIPHALMERL